MSKNAVTLVTRTASGIDYWDARWYDPVNGKRRAKSLGRCDQVSERQARVLMSRIQIKFDDNPLARSTQEAPTLKEWMTLFIERQIANGRKPATLRDYHTIQRLLQAHFGAGRRVNSIGKYDLEQFKLKLAQGKLRKAFIKKHREKLSTSSVDKYMRNVRTIFTLAFDDELIERNPGRKLSLSSTPASPWDKVSGEDFWKLYNAAEGGMKTLVALCRLAALRASDALALKWSNVRLDEGVIVFRPIKVERFAKRDARVPIGAELRTILEDLRKESFRIDRLVVKRDFPRDVGTLKFPEIFAKAGLTPWEKPLHTLRKSCIDDWAKVAPPNVVMEWATHSSLNTTMKYYSKVSPGDEQIGQVKMFKEKPGPGAQGQAV